MHLVIYLKNKIENIKLILSKAFNVSFYDISNLFDYEETIIRYEIIELSDNNDGFFLELNIYTELNDFISNNLMLAIELNKKLKCEILINDESYNPYQWILINTNNKIFLVESKEISDELILIEKIKGELNLKKSIEKLSKYNFENKAYHIKIPSEWEELLLPPHLDI